VAILLWNAAGRLPAGARGRAARAAALDGDADGSVVVLPRDPRRRRVGVREVVGADVDGPLGGVGLVVGRSLAPPEPVAGVGFGLLLVGLCDVVEVDPVGHS